MGVLAITQFLGLEELAVEGARESHLTAIGLNRTQVVGNRTIVSGGMLKCLDRQIEAGGITHCAAVVGHFLQHPGIILSIDDDG